MMERCNYGIGIFIGGDDKGSVISVGSVGGGCVRERRALISASQLLFNCVGMVISA